MKSLPFVLVAAGYGLLIYKAGPVGIALVVLHVALMCVCARVRQPTRGR
jgi:hypothetical protein